MSRKKKPQETARPEPQGDERSTFQNGGLPTSRDLNWRLLWDAVDDGINILVHESEISRNCRHPECLYNSLINLTEVVKVLWVMQLEGLIPKPEGYVGPHMGRCTLNT